LGKSKYFHTRSKKETDYVNSDKYKEEQRKLKERRDKEAVQRARETVSNFKPMPYDRGKRGMRFARPREFSPAETEKERREREDRERVKAKKDRKKQYQERMERTKPRRGFKKAWFDIIKWD